ncbi:cupredoxin domain-containing protein [Candidatus Nitrosotenuis uzonensis]|nr:plastocyanin/azurin family copper-binding protein [Candidatus Nitrosotenuis uzonensis]
MNIKLLASIAVFAFLVSVVGTFTMQPANAEDIKVKLQTNVAITDTVTTETKSTAVDVTKRTTASVAVDMAEGAASNTECSDQCYVPNNIKIAVGGTVTWENVDSAAHTVTASDGSFDSGLVMSEKTFSHEFGTVGTFGYACTVHPWMKGTVTVG